MYIGLVHPQIRLGSFLKASVLCIYCNCPQKKFKVCVVGSGGGIGQPLCMLLKYEPLVTCLAMYDISKMSPGVGVDVSHISTKPYVYSFSGLSELPAALFGNIFLKF